ncbi:hypothetical protein FKM82_022132, partial [Ascaphus truei]
MPVVSTTDEGAPQKDVRTLQAEAGLSPVGSTASTPSGDPTTPKALSPMQDSPLASPECDTGGALASSYLQAKEGDRPQPEGASSETSAGGATSILQLSSESSKESTLPVGQEAVETHKSCVSADALNQDTLDTRIVMGEETYCSNEETGTIKKLDSLIPDNEPASVDTLDGAPMHSYDPKAEMPEGNSGEESSDREVIASASSDLHLEYKESHREYALKRSFFSQGEEAADVPLLSPEPTKELTSSPIESENQSLPIKSTCNMDSDLYTTAPSTPTKNMYSLLKHPPYSKDGTSDEQNDMENESLCSSPTSPSGSYITAEGGSWASSGTSTGSPSCSPNLMAEADTMEAPNAYTDSLTAHEEGPCEDPCCMSPDILGEEDISALYVRNIQPQDLSPANEEVTDADPSDGQTSGEEEEDEEDEEEWETDFAPSFTSIPLCSEFVNAGALGAFSSVPYQTEHESRAGCSSEIEETLQATSSEELPSELPRADLQSAENDHMIPAVLLPFQGSLIFEAESMEITLFPQGESAENEVIYGEEDDDSTSASFLHSLSEASINEGVDESFAYQDDTSESSDSASYDGEADEKRYSTEQYALTTDSVPQTEETPAGPLQPKHESSNSGCESEMETSSDLSDTDDECAVFTAIDVDVGDLASAGEHAMDEANPSFKDLGEDTNDSEDKEINSDQEQEESDGLPLLAQGLSLPESEEAHTTQDSSSEPEEYGTSNASHEEKDREHIRSTLVLTSEALTASQFVSPSVSERLEEREGEVRSWSDSPIEQQSSSSELDEVLQAGIDHVGECLIACFDTDEELDTLPLLNTAAPSMREERRGYEQSGRQSSMAIGVYEDAPEFIAQAEAFDLGEHVAKSDSRNGHDAVEALATEEILAPCTTEAQDLGRYERALQIMELERQDDETEVTLQQYFQESGEDRLEDMPEEECLFACYDSDDDQEDGVPLDRHSLITQIYRQQGAATANYVINRSSHGPDSSISGAFMEETQGEETYAGLTSTASTYQLASSDTETHDKKDTPGPVMSSGILSERNYQIIVCKNEEEQEQFTVDRELDNMTTESITSEMPIEVTDGNIPLCVNQEPREISVNLEEATKDNISVLNAESNTEELGSTVTARMLPTLSEASPSPLTPVTMHAEGSAELQMGLSWSTSATEPSEDHGTNANTQSKLDKYPYVSNIEECNKDSPEDKLLEDKDAIVEDQLKQQLQSEASGNSELPANEEGTHRVAADQPVSKEPPDRDHVTQCSEQSRICGDSPPLPERHASSDSIPLQDATTSILQQSNISNLDLETNLGRDPLLDVDRAQDDNYVAEISSLECTVTNQPVSEAQKDKEKTSEEGLVLDDLTDGNIALQNKMLCPESTDCSIPAIPDATLEGENVLDTSEKSSDKQLSSRSPTHAAVSLTAIQEERDTGLEKDSTGITSLSTGYAATKELREQGDYESPTHFEDQVENNLSIEICGTQHVAGNQHAGAFGPGDVVHSKDSDRKAQDTLGPISKTPEGQRPTREEYSGIKGMDTALCLDNLGKKEANISSVYLSLHSASAFSKDTAKLGTSKPETSNDFQEMTRLLQGSFGKLDALDLSTRSGCSENSMSRPKSNTTKVEGNDGFASDLLGDKKVKAKDAKRKPDVMAYVRAQERHHETHGAEACQNKKVLSKKSPAEEVLKMHPSDGRERGDFMVATSSERSHAILLSEDRTQKDKAGTGFYYTDDHGRTGEKAHLESHGLTDQLPCHVLKMQGEICNVAGNTEPDRGLSKESSEELVSTDLIKRTQEDRKPHFVKLLDSKLHSPLHESLQSGTALSPIHNLQDRGEPALHICSGASKVPPLSTSPLADHKAQDKREAVLLLSSEESSGNLYAENMLSAVDSKKLSLG